MTYTDHGGSLYSLDGFSPNERAALVVLRERMQAGEKSDWEAEDRSHVALQTSPLLLWRSPVPGWAIARWLRRLEAWLAWDYERYPDRPADADSEDGEGDDLDAAA